ncbi:MAG TPA: GPR endopeptidase [Paenibacillaceae bacterium]
MPEPDLQAYAVRTDLALEARDMAASPGEGEVPGVWSETESRDGIRVTRMEIRTDEASRKLGKMKGHYVTLEVPGLRNGDSDLYDRVADCFAREFEAFLGRLGVSASASVLIVGLGNVNVTPDALGPMVVENLLVTRHLFELMRDQVDPGYRPVSAIAPGVLGTTGIETSEIVQGVVERTKPDLLIAVDALAARSLERVNTTIQIADTGIHPGSGIGNRRRGLTKEILGVPCLAIGVPTVVYASTIVNNALDMLFSHIKQQTSDSDSIIGSIGHLEEPERLQLVKEVLDPLGQDLLVTPKEVDEFMEATANIVATGLNVALHEAVRRDNAAAYTR